MFCIIFSAQLHLAVFLRISWWCDPCSKCRDSHFVDLSSLFWFFFQIFIECFLFFNFSLQSLFHDPFVLWIRTDWSIGSRSLLWALLGHHVSFDYFMLGWFLSLLAVFLSLDSSFFTSWVHARDTASMADQGLRHCDQSELRTTLREEQLSAPLKPNRKNGSSFVSRVIISPMRSQLGF